MKLPYLAPALTLLLHLTPAHADSFGEASSAQLGVDRAMGIFLERQSVKADSMGVESETTLKTTTAGLLALDGATVAGTPRLTFDYFVAPKISVGGSFVYVTSSSSSVFSSDNNAADTDSDLGSTSVLALHPRAGYAIEFNDSWGVWPHGGLLFARHAQTIPDSVNADGSVTETTTSATTLALSLDGMFYVTPVEHFVVMGGPFLDLGFWGTGSVQTEGSADRDFDAGLTAFGLSFALGAYF